MEKSQKDILIIGVDGMLGQALFKEASREFLVAGTTIKTLDITDKKSVKGALQGIRPKIVVLTAAYTDVDGSEKNPEEARRVNVNGVANVAEAAKKINASLIYISTDYVFDGKKRSAYREQDKPRPLGVYGQTKLEGEKTARRILKRTVIIRSSWLFGQGKQGFVQFILRGMRSQKPLRIVDDKTGSPTYVIDLSGAICSVIGLMIKGRLDFKKYAILHITNSGVCSWLDMAKFIAKCCGIKSAVFEKIHLSEFPFAAKRPKHSPLNNSLFRKLTGNALRPWQEALEEFIKCQSI